MPTNRHWPSLANPPQLHIDDVHAWAVPLDLSQQAYAELFEMLASDERKRSSDFRFDDPRRRYVISRGALRRLLGAYLDLQPTAIQLTVDQNQKPRLAHNSASTGL